MWLFLWIVFVLVVVAAFIWSYHVIYEQKRSWRAFAKKYNLDYAQGTFFSPPVVAGLLKGRRVNIYSQQSMDNNQASKITYSVIEIFFREPPDVFAFVTSQGFVDFMGQVDLPVPFFVQDPKWPANVLSRTLEGEDPAQWFTDEQKRIDGINSMIKLPFDTAFVADGDQAFIAVRTSDALLAPKKINHIVGKMFDILAQIEDGQSPQTAKPKDDKETVRPDSSASSA